MTDAESAANKRVKHLVEANKPMMDERRKAMAHELYCIANIFAVVYSTNMLVDDALERLERLAEDHLLKAVDGADELRAEVEMLKNLNLSFQVDEVIKESGIAVQDLRDIAERIYQPAPERLAGERSDDAG